MNTVLEEIGQNALPRILTQICRDPESPFFGCADRNWWHYKIRDFPSIILQQAGYALFAAEGLFEFSQEEKNSLRELAKGSCLFWNKRAVRHGAFEEYYPYEQGYPPLAFSTLTVTKLVRSGVVKYDDVAPGLQISGKRLLQRFEWKAVNQQVAGVAALAVLRDVAPDMVNEEALNELLERILALQTTEGWFPEYEGPDLGYLSVTLDCLFDIWDCNGNASCRMAIEKAFDFISWFVRSPFGGAGMLNSRNTDYIVPYGLTRLAVDDWDKKEEAAWVFHRLFGEEGTAKSFLLSVDDRYWCHYVGHSVFRALQIIKEAKERGNEISATGRILSYPCGVSAEKKDSGYVLLAKGETSLPKVLVAGNKGCVFTAQWDDDAWVSDYGWEVKMDGKLFVSHWWSNDWTKDWTKDKATEDAVCCKGYFVPHREHASTPFKHFILRCGSFFFGYRLIKYLKQLLIFKKNTGMMYFTRSLEIQGEHLIVKDSVSGIDGSAQVRRAPRSSKRHVASADSFHREDLALSRGVLISEERVREEKTFICTTLISRDKGAR